MDIPTKLKGKKKFLFFLLVFGVLIKYNYLIWSVFQAPSLISLLFKNIIITAFIILLFDSFTKNNKRKKLTFAIYFFFLIFFLANLWYNRYFGNYLSLTDITMGQGIRPFKVLIRQLIRWQDIIFIIELPFLTYLLLFTKDKSKYSYNKNFFKVSKGLDKFILAGLIIILLTSQIVYSSSLFKEKGFLNLYEYSTPAFVSVYGIIPLYIAEYRLIRKRDQRENNAAEIDAVATEQKMSGKYKLDNVKNIIVIQLESVDKNIIDYEYEGKEITPFLNKLKRSSLNFTDIYAHHINGSFDAEFSFLTSLYPINRNYAFKTNDMAEFKTLNRILAEKGFQTLAFHGNDDGFFYRGKGYLEMGFDKFYSRDHFSASEGFIGDDSYLGINDYDFFDQSLDYLAEAEENIFALLITVSSHTPFDFYPEEKSVEEFEDISPKIVKDYFNSMAFVDKSLEMFFNGIKELSSYEDTLFVVYSDHVADINYDKYSSGGNFLANRNIKEPEHIPLFIYHQDLYPEEIDKTGTHTDIAPTILDILGYPEKPKEFLGVSLLKDIEKPVFFLHEIPQVLYKDQLYLRLPATADGERNFTKIARKVDSAQREHQFSSEEKARMDQIINYMQKIMNTILSED